VKLFVSLSTIVALSAPAAAQTPAQFDSALKAAYAKYKSNDSGAVADYIPELGKVDPKLFGIALVTPDGKAYAIGDADSLFSIQSISKVFTMAQDMEELGAGVVKEKLGVDATGLRFNSIVAIELQRGKEMNPLVNPGAIAAVSLLPAANATEKWNKIIGGESGYAGRALAVNEPVYKSEAATNQRNRAIAMLMFAYDRLYSDPLESTDLYTRQCAINVSAKDLAMMAATLANGGVNPVTKKRMLRGDYVPKVLAVMATAGLYDNTGQWMYDVGLPAKSGVGGGIIAVAPGRFGIAVFSPRLDGAGNSVRAQLVIADVARAFHADVYLSSR
jgi:glutaminase